MNPPINISTNPEAKYISNISAFGKGWQSTNILQFLMQDTCKDDYISLHELFSMTDLSIYFIKCGMQCFLK